MLQEAQHLKYKISTCGAKFISLGSAVDFTLFLLHIICSIIPDFKSIVFCDNWAAVLVASNKGSQICIQSNVVFDQLQSLITLSCFSILPHFISVFLLLLFSMCFSFIKKIPSQLFYIYLILIFLNFSSLPNFFSIMIFF
ncbi:uncharacterized protein VP01_4240g1 [Puccinia sorghi]|uniref:Uncharacterized protein n=1 Tax=Puccinia sorghi TaxID=27349 RepID=A0A0L6UQH2_9BASI|nr:uncharacterized protein VP01_4240g1 [Puccinia sorghi]